MQFHSRVGLVTNSSSETFSFSSLGREQHTIDQAVNTLWIEFCLEESNHDLLRAWWDEGWDCTGSSPGKDAGEYTREKAIAWGAPVTFYIQQDGKAEVFTSMDNETATDEFCRFVEKRMNAHPAHSGEQRSICVECMARGWNTCPPCRL